MEQKGKKDAQDHGPETNKMQQNDYTRPPRISFGIELEFLVARIGQDKPDVDKDMPGLAPATQTDGQDVVQKLLKKHGFNTSTQAAAHSSANQLWIITGDGSVKEKNNRREPPYCTLWDSVEISSPPLYSSEEAYNLVSAVVRLLTTNLRVRVNASCGLHVHVGNGPHQLDLRALRNYAALLWASEPVLSTLHCPTRSFTFWSNSIRRRQGLNLAKGATANEAHRWLLDEPRIVPRFISRARKFGESPTTSHTSLRQHLRTDGNDPLMLELSYDNDESDWEDADSKPFERPKKPKGPRREELKGPREVDICSDEARAALLDSESTRRELPPQIVFPVSEIMASCVTPGRLPLLNDQRTKKKPISCREIDTLPRNRNEINLPRRDDDDFVDIDSIEANTKLAWRGVAELLACDVGAHQLAYLMTSYDEFTSYACKGRGSNWKGQLPDNLFPKEEGRLSHPTVESRLAAGSLDAEWVVTWTKIQCRLLEWARDADPAQFMNVIGKLSRDDHSQECTYDVLDFLRDIGMYTELKYCQERLRRCEEAWYQCILMKPKPSCPTECKACDNRGCVNCRISPRQQSERMVID
ncbi:hypothetical protein FLAG1_03490 [Fusarium langsethiae]|uniref:Amidoligase enzyme n=1 Tax=Fusarium langsethiae TaxID=179993 RepID=A0A0M9F128_FUSLA|nr:hypothetical protein FLAG1_03490 [Fusarium langsethiae]GKU01447.1 unnamed protein product [Fusarium langsethiae]